MQGKKRKREKKAMMALLAIVMTASTCMGSVQVYARSSKRAAWNNASGTSGTASEVSDACYAEDGSETAQHSVYPNVYADAAAWTAWQTQWQQVKDNYEQIALTPGADATKMNFAWDSLTEETPKIKLMNSSGEVLGFTEGTQNTDQEETVTSQDKQYVLIPNKVTVSGLTENTTYQYAYWADGAWSPAYSFTTHATDSFSVFYVGDPQIGASVGQDTNSAEYHAMNDAYNWNCTLQNAIRAHGNVSFMLSAGDQINQSDVSTAEGKLEQQTEYAGFLASPVLRSLPVATTIGNHDSKSVNYSDHFNNPNAAAGTADTLGKTAAGTDYYFTYGSVLFVVIDTNNYNCATHENVIKEATASAPDAKWKILMFHQDIYGSGYDHSDSDGIALRTQLTPIINQYGFDAVLQGHDHTYSRTYQLGATGLTENANCYNIVSGATDTTKVVNPSGTVFYEANSASGSKFYQLMGTQQDYVAARCQSWRPTYSVIDFTANTLTVKTYDAATNEELVADGNVKTAYTIVKSADKTALNNAIAEAESKLETARNAGTHTQESLDALQQTITAAKQIVADDTATATAIASGVSSLTDAENALAVKPTEAQQTTEQTTQQTTTASQTTVQTGTLQTGSASGTSSLKGASDTSPATGDSTLPMIVWFTIAGGTALGLLGMIIAGRRSRRQNESK